MSHDIILAGAAPDTGNLGVSALCYSVVSNLLSQNAKLNIKILSHGKGLKSGAYQVGAQGACDLLGAKHSNRFYDSSSFTNIYWVSRLMPSLTREGKTFRESRAILDISGGDSFTDLYEKRRFDAIVFPKKIALQNNIPLVLLPQTYGPFDNPRYKGIAANIVKRSTLAYARDKYSFEYLKELLGDDYDSSRHQQAVDVAFILPATDGESLVRRGILPQAEPAGEIFGINVSGLIFNQPERAKSQYKISLDYPQVIIQTLEHILANSEGQVWLVPHVLAPPGHYESDIFACETVKNMMPEKFHHRIHVIGGDFDQCDIKGVISRCSWFCGTRMHSTIASLSSTVPTAAIAYSGKFKGVFESAGQEAAAYDARAETTDGMISNLVASWENRGEIAKVLQTTISAVRKRSMEQFADILAHI